MSFRALLAALLACLFCSQAIGMEPDVVVAVSRVDDAFVVDATIDIPVTLRTAWGVLVDFDHMASILTNLTSSKILSRDGATLLVRQEGIAKYGPFSYPFQSEREIRLEPMRRILAKSLSGSVRRMESATELIQRETGKGVLLRYRAEIVPDSVLARLFGLSFVRHEVMEQFQLIVAEMRLREEWMTTDPQR
ncbi:MAG TPA: SRPBCC family protein [Rhodocyclaceae bacterium]